jgi:NAD-dependent dihydropyrimidine dehydrogenase PreA subunit
MMATTSRGDIIINAHLCKGCGLCTGACPPGVLVQSNFLNRQGYYAIAYTGSGCTGCGICFYVCPEPGAITIRKQVKDSSEVAPKPGPAQGEPEPAAV